MKKNIYLTVLTIATVACIIFGTLNHSGILGRTSVRYDAWEINASGSAGSTQSEKGTVNEKSAASDKTLLSEKRADDTVTKMHADLNYGSLTVRIGEEFSAEYNGDDDLQPEVTVENGILTIVQKNRNYNFFKPMLNPKAELIVTLPKGTILDEAKLALDFGDLSVSGLIIAEGTVENSMGRINFDSCGLTTMTIEADMGDVEITDCSFESLFIEEDLGKVSVRSAQDLSEAAIELETDLGKIMVNGANIENDYSTSGTNGVRLSVRNDMGDVVLEY